MKHGWILALAALVAVLPTGASAMSGGKRIFDEKNKRGAVEVYEKAGGAFRYLVEDGLLRSWTGDEASKRAHLSFIIAPDKAKRVLVIGPGAGAAVDAAFFNGAESVDVALKNPLVLKAAGLVEERFGKAMKDPRTRITYVGAAGGWAGAAKGKYDAAILWAAVFPPEEIAAGLTVEDLTELKNMLNPGGTASIWIPLGLFPPARTKALLATFGAVFPQMTIWLPGMNPDLGWAVVVGSAAARKIDLAAAEKRLKGIFGPYKILERDNTASFLSFYVTDQTGLAKALKGVKPRHKADVSHKVKLPGWEKGGNLSADNYRLLAGLRTPVSGKTNAAGDEAKRLDDYFQARTLLFDSILKRGKGANAKETDLYAEAMRLAPDDPNLAQRYMVLGRMFLSVDMPDKAAWLLETAKKIDPNNAEIRYMLGRAYEKMNRSEKATPEFAKMKELDPDFLKYITDMEMGKP
jgi:spermidine synthase